MRNVYASSSDHLPDIAKFHLGEKIFIPNQVDKAELHIITANGTKIIAFSKAALSFYLGSQIPDNFRELKYIIYVKSDDNLSSLGFENSKDLSQSLTSLASVHLSDIAAEDETEGLLKKIGNLEQSLFLFTDPRH
jgi:hypothetical protein